MKSQAQENFYRHLALTSDHPLGLELERASGSYLHLKDGSKILDFISGIAVSSLGHGHPSVLKAIHEQADKHLHVMVYGEMIIQPQANFVGLLTQQLPDNLDCVYLTNSGTEAIEGALKLAKKFTGRSKLISFHHSYHGDTQGSLSVTGRKVYREPFEPLLPNVHFCDFNKDDFKTAVDENTACVILEPIQGEGGIISAEKEWLQALREKCNNTGALLIFDEIQSGFGRTGSLFAFQNYEVIPDILCIAKAAGGGLPLGGFISSSEILDSLRRNPALSHVTTFGGHPLSCAAAHASLKTILDENLIVRASWIEEEIRTKLKHELIVEIRGVGCMLGMELSSKKKTQKFVEACLEKGLLLGWTLHSDTLVRLAPPLTISETDLNIGLDTMLEVLHSIN